jgi:hypothetical protein
VLGVATAKDRCFVVFSNINITMNELNGQWLDCGGKSCFCPDNSFDYWDYFEDEPQQENPNTNPQSKSQTEIDYDEF